jgi:hypothetical protein
MLEVTQGFDLDKPSFSGFVPAQFSTRQGSAELCLARTGPAPGYLTKKLFIAQLAISYFNMIEMKISITMFVLHQKIQRVTKLLLVFSSSAQLIGPGS